MATKIDETERPRSPLSRERILGEAVALADQECVESPSMGRLAQATVRGPRALSNPPPSKTEVLNGMVQVAFGEFDPPLADTDWKTAMRERILSARRALLPPPSATHVVVSARGATPAA